MKPLIAIAFSVLLLTGCRENGIYESEQGNSAGQEVGNTHLEPGTDQGSVRPAQGQGGQSGVQGGQANQTVPGTTAPAQQGQSGTGTGGAIQTNNVSESQEQ